MPLRDTLTSILRAAARPRGTRATPLSPEATFGTAAPPASGSRPSPGPVPTQSQPKGEPDAAAPLRWNYPYAANQLLTPRQGLTPFEQLRALADMHDVIRICIETRKDQLCSLRWDVVARDAATSRRAPTKAERDAASEVRAFFQRPDRRRPFSSWLRMAIEDVLVVDALSIYRRRTYGGDLVALELKDGATFKVLVDESGDVPLPPSVAYRQIIGGQPVEGGDCTVDDLLYRPRSTRTHTPYGMSPTEAVLLTVQSALNRQVFNLSYFAEGNVPEGLMDAPEGWTANQIREFQDYFDTYLTGNMGARRRLKLVGAGMAASVKQFKEPSFTTDFDLWLLKIVCAAYGVTPSDVGFTDDVNKATAGAQENISHRRGTKPLALFFKEIFDEIISADLQQPDFEMVFSGGEQEDLLMQARRDEIYVKLGKTSLDELRARDGQELIGMGPAIWTAQGPVFIESLVASRDSDPTRSDPRETAPAPAQTTPPPARNDQVDDGTDPAVPQDDQPDSEQQQAAVERAIDTELKRWRTVAVKRAKSGQALKAFASDVIPRDLHAHISAGLDGASVSAPLTAAAVHGVFATIEKDRQADRLRKDAERRYRRAFRAHFAAQGAALTDHLASRLTAPQE